jgi:hypothetical protein
MPNYNAQNPPYAIFPGDAVNPFNAESPAPPQASQQYALPHFTGDHADQSRSVSWQTSYATTPTSVTVQLQASDVDADANYATVDSSTNTAGERKTTAGVRARFIRWKLNAQTGGGAITITAGV